MRPRRFRAPGKLMLAGEHSVLAVGGEALALAVEGGVEVEAHPAAEWELVRAESGICWRPGEPIPLELRFAQAAWQEAQEALGDLPPHRLICRAPGGPHATAGKPGLGGSAAATVGVVAALHALAGGSFEGAGRRALLEAALRAHRRAQHERGSGYDVVTVTLGGLIRWRPPEMGAPSRSLPPGGMNPPGLPGASALFWPEGLHVVAGFSGRSAPTAPLLARIAAAPELDTDLRVLGVPVQALVEAFARADLPVLLAGVGACHRALAAWDARRNLGLITPELAHLLWLAEQAGAACKISGAGGGDSVVALSSSREPLEQLAVRWQQAGFHPFWPVAAHDGVRELL
jgi:phosphomevalonate kinase